MRNDEFIRLFKREFYKLMTYMNYKRDKELDTYVFVGERKKKRKYYNLTKEKIHLINSFL